MTVVCLTFGYSKNKEWLRKTIRKLEDQFKQQWLTDCTNNPRCTNYRIFANHSFQKYISVLPENLRVSLTKYRLGNRLPGVLGRNNNKERDTMLCSQCDKGEIGDEFHYLLKCPRFNEQRISYLKNYCHHPNVLIFNDIMNKTDYQVIRKLAISVMPFKRKYLRVSSFNLLFPLIPAFPLI
jgi:hypothetical protein